MTDDERHVRAILQTEAQRAPRPAGMRAATVRRARRGRTGFVALSLAGCMLAFGGALAGVNALDADVVPPPRPQTTPDAGASGRIVFTRFAPEGGIFVMDAQGGDARRVVDGDYHALDEPAWSPDGSRIAFHGFFGEAANEAGGLFLMDADGSDRRLLALGGGSPTWSPDGHHIAFTRDGELFTIAADSGQVRHLAPDVEVEFPDWSPDGEDIVFSHSGISVMSRHGYSVERVAPEVVDYRSVHPVWSPDGTQIAFTRYEGTGSDGSVDVIGVDGTGHRSVTRGRAPAWSPDGTRLAFERTDGNVSHIYSIAVDGSDLRQLTFGPDSDHSPDWTAAPEPSGCPAVGEGGYEITLTPARAGAGTTVTATGPIPVDGKDGVYSPTEDGVVHFWLDADGRRWEELIRTGLRPDEDPPGAARYLGGAGIGDPEACEFDFTFEMPDVPPGDHSVVAVVFARRGAAHYDDASIAVPDPTPECGRTNIASDEYGTEIDPVAGPPGTEVTLSGTTMRGEDWRWAPSDRLEAWWNTDVPAAHGRPIADGPVLRLVRVDDMERCRFAATFTVPEVEPGRYRISVFAWDADPAEGYGWFLPHHFTVTDG